MPPALSAAKRKHYKVDKSGDNWNDDGSYIVGKGRPPKRSQWEKGQSGNPQGPKPQIKHDPIADFDRELLAPFEVMVNGEPIKLTNLTLAVQALRKATGKGTISAAENLIRHCLGAIQRSADRNRTPEIEVWEQDAIDTLLSHLGLPPHPVVRDTDRTSGK